MGVVISFINNKGGVGKTTSAFNIGHAWAKMEKKILFIDLDSQSNLTSMVSDTNTLSVEWERTLEDAFVDGEGLPILHTDNPLIDFVPTDLSLANFERDTASTKTIKEYLLLDLVEPVRKDYDYVIIDCPPAISTITYNAMIASDYLVLVTLADVLSIKGVQMTISLYNEIIANKRFNPNLEIAGCLINRYEKDKISAYCLEELKKQYDFLIIDPVIRKSTIVKQSTSFSKSIYDMDAKKAGPEFLKAAQDIALRVYDLENRKENK